MRISGRVAVVTGASSGIGRATALALARKGAHVVLAARRRDRLEELQHLISSRGGEATVVPCDVTRPEDIRRLASSVEDSFARCDILVNNAGIPSGGRFDDLSIERIDQVVDTNLRSILHTTKAFLPMMRAQGRGHILNISSLAGRHAVPGAAVYSATKHAVVAFSESMNHETAPDGVLVTAICPGFVDTEGFPQGHLPNSVIIPMPVVTRAILRTIERDRAPVVTVPRLAGSLEVFRLLTPGPYRWAAGKAMMRRHRDR